MTNFTQDTGSVNVSFTNISATPKTDTTFSTDPQRTAGIDGESETVSGNSSLAGQTRGEGQKETYELAFDTAVSNVDFNINEITGDSLVSVRAFDADGNPIEVTLVAGGGLTLLDTDGVAGVDTADSDGGYASSTDPFYSMNVSIAGPVSRIEITHNQNGPNGSDLNITDVFFTTGDIVVVDESNDDDLSGDDGDDTIFGETGDDTITGGEGSDSLSGGDDADLFVGGDAGDVVDGGTGGDDNDTLDLRDSDPLRVVGQTADADGDSTSGTIEFLNTDGTVSGTMTFAEIENLLLLEGNVAPVAEDDADETDEDTLVTIDVLGNDSDEDGDELTVTEATSDDGTVVINADGTLDFTPNPDFNGEATINYTISDGNGGTESAIVIVTVNPINDAPVAVDDADTTPKDTAVIVDLTGNYTDVDNTNDELSIAAVSVPAEQGTVADNGDGTVTFTPADGFTGDATITYTVSDPDGLTDEGIATVTVTPAANVAPVANDDADVTGFNTTTTIDLLANDTDVDTPLEDLFVVEATVPADQLTWPPRLPHS